MQRQNLDINGKWAQTNNLFPSILRIFEALCPNWLLFT